MTSIFVDSSVLMAASLSSIGNAQTLLQYGARNVLSLIWSDVVIAEVERNLTRKAPGALPSLDLLRDSGVFRHTIPPDALVMECTQIVHTKDAAILAASIHAQVEWIATYDRRHLLTRREDILARDNITTARPDEILETLGLSQHR